MVHRIRGCYTAIISPITADLRMDYEGLKSLIDFQVEEGASGVVVAGTTGESPTLNWEEHNRVIATVHERINGRSLTIGGVGSNSTSEALKATEYVSNIGVEGVLLVDPYYNGPSSLEIRREYVEPIAKRFPETQLIPYVIPSRTGTQLLPQDLAVLHHQLSNVNAVKEATGSMENMKLTRKLCGNDFFILSGDDDKTFEMMTDQEILASGVVSVVSNVAPRAVQEFTESILEGDLDKSLRLQKTLSPLFSMVTVKTQEETPYGCSLCKARNPLPLKTLMNVLGMTSGPCRPPLGKLTKKGLEIVLNVARTVQENTPEILRPIERFFDVDLDQRLCDDRSWRGLSYD
ncbi:MAG: 4-hydroxy-tetrahydrodipicolinate synthase [archaeon]